MKKPITTLGDIRAEHERALREARESFEKFDPHLCSDGFRYYKTKSGFVREDGKGKIKGSVDAIGVGMAKSTVERRLTKRKNELKTWLAGRVEVSRGDVIGKDAKFGIDYPTSRRAMSFDFVDEDGPDDFYRLVYYLTPAGKARYVVLKDESEVADVAAS